LAGPGSVPTRYYARLCDPIRWVTYRLVGRRPIPPLVAAVKGEEGPQVNETPAATPAHTPHALAAFGSMDTVARALVAKRNGTAGGVVVVPPSADLSRSDDRNVIEQVRRRLENLSTTTTIMKNLNFNDKNNKD